jgi:DNA-binding transcriptional ArsR family regulator
MRGLCRSGPEIAGPVPRLSGLTYRFVSCNLRLVVTYQDALTALADPTRRGIFERLASGPQAVVDIAEGFSVSRPAVSQHLRVLKDAGLVSDTHIGTRRLYQINPAGLSVLRDYLDRFWDQALASFKAFAEGEQARSEGEKT